MSVPFARPIASLLLGVATLLVLQTPSLAEVRLEDHLASQLHRINQVEIQIAQLAEKKAAAPDTRRYAETLLRDMTAADLKLMQVAAEMKIRIASAVPRNEYERQPQIESAGVLQKLKAARSPEFDELFLKGVKDVHSEVIRVLKSTRDDLGDSNLKDYIYSKLLPQIHMQRDVASNLESRFVSQAP